MPQDFSDKFSPAERENGIDLKHHLLLRITLFALAIGVFATGVVLLYQARERIRVHIADSGNTVARLIAGEAVQPRGTFRHSLEGLKLASLDGIGQLLGICVEVGDIYKQPIVQRCFGEKSDPPAAVRWVLGHLIGPEIHYRGAIGQYPGFKVGEFVVTPNLDSEALAVAPDAHRARDGYRHSRP